jgi:hypothetical protein
LWSVQGFTMASQLDLLLMLGSRFYTWYYYASIVCFGNEN